MAASSDLVSVVIPAYNAERWIPQTLATVRAQTHRELEVIVVDDGSTDRTAEVAADALAGFHGRVEIVRQDNKGLPATRNVGFRASRGRWVHFMDADDLVTPDMIALLHREAVRDPDAAVVYGPYCRLFDDESGRPPSPGATYVPDVDPAAPASLLHAIVLIQASLIHREWFEVIGGFNGELRYVAEDRDFLIRMAVAGGRFIRASAHDPVCLWRMHPGIPRVGGSEAKYRASESMFVWMMSPQAAVSVREL
ncbi:MAG: glycosyltransferase family A protein [Gemmataceae bacterium]